MTRTNGSSPRRAIVIGGSMSGLFAASLLRKAGWRTDVYERSDVELRGRGAGIVTHPDLIQSLERSDAQLKDLGVTVHERVALDSGRVALIGDAAAVARPHVGMGIAKAGTDAEVLADSLASYPDLREGLGRFERERLPIAGKAVAQGRRLGEYMLDHASPENGANDARWREFHRIPGILKHTASSAFLRSA
jgi:2-polyprenyl-6-methoxyphenol hydroxylase-like FAD-dependent oxidoreductase